MEVGPAGGAGAAAENAIAMVAASKTGSRTGHAPRRDMRYGVETRGKTRFIRNSPVQIGEGGWQIGTDGLLHPSRSQLAVEASHGGWPAVRLITCCRCWH